jgi:glycosyltransferase involved in cell wall biosynthesis
MRVKICLISSAQYTVEVFLLDQLLQLSTRYDVTLLVKTAEPDFLAKRGIAVKVVPAPIERRISLLQDIEALWFVYRTLSRQGFQLVHSTTPKGGILAMLGALAARVPVRIHTFTGQVWASRGGPLHWILKSVDRITALVATHIVVDSGTQRDYLIRQRVVSPAKSRVLANGSISGVDVARFAPNPQRRAAVRARHAIPATALVFLFMARLTRDKGALVMAEGFARFCRNGGVAHLLIVGPDEEKLRPRMREVLGAALEFVHFEDYTTIPQDFMAAADIFCLPSYREGFGTVLINAAAAGIPCIASRIYGSVDAVDENVTGLLHEAGNSAELASCMQRLALDGPLRALLGRNGRERAARDFSEERVTAALLEFYDQALAATRA